MTEERILVIANEGLEDPALLQAIEDLGQGSRNGASVRIAAPVEKEPDVERQRGDTAARLARAVTVLRQNGLQARGHPADADPILALEHALAQFAATRIVISTFALGRSRWLGKGLIEWAREATFAPVTHVVTEPRRAPVMALPVTERPSIMPRFWRTKAASRTKAPARADRGQGSPVGKDAPRGRWNASAGCREARRLIPGACRV